MYPWFSRHPVRLVFYRNDSEANSSNRKTDIIRGCEAKMCLLMTLFGDK